MYLSLVKKMHILFFLGVAKHHHVKDSIVFFLCDYICWSSDKKNYMFHQG